MSAIDSQAFVKAVRLHPDDSVAVLVEEAASGKRVRIVGDAQDLPLVVSEPIPFGHKVALRPIKAGSPVLKYGEPMGIATREIAPGSQVHVHNVRGLESDERGGVGHGIEHVQGI